MSILKALIPTAAIVLAFASEAAAAPHTPPPPRPDRPAGHGAEMPPPPPHAPHRPGHGPREALMHEAPQHIRDAELEHRSLDDQLRWELASPSPNRAKAMDLWRRKHDARRIVDEWMFERELDRIMEGGTPPPPPPPHAPGEEPHRGPEGTPPPPPTSGDRPPAPPAPR